MHGWETRIAEAHLERGVSGGVVEALRGESPDDPGVDRRVWTGTCRRVARATRRGRRWRTSWNTAMMRVRRFPGCRRSGCLRRSVRPATAVARVRDYVRAARPRPAVEPVVRFETPAGHQGQVDFATFNLPWGRRHALLVVLSYRTSGRRCRPPGSFHVVWRCPEGVAPDACRRLSDASAASWC